VSTFYTDCLDPNNLFGGVCDGSDVSAKCYACLYTTNPKSASKWGLLLASKYYVEFNTGGCNDVASSDTACDDASQDLYECEHAKCDSQSSQANYDSCIKTAEGTGGTCKCYVDLMGTACASHNGSSCDASTTTGPYSDFQSAFLGMAKAMCE
jgi:hypothetical protein